MKPGTVIAPSLSERSRSTSWSMSIADTRPSPSHTGHMPSGLLNPNAVDVPTCGTPTRLKTIRSIVWASVAVPTVDREFAPIRSWSTMIAALRLRSASTSGLPWLGMNDWMNAVYVSLISRCDSAAIVPNTSDDLPDPDTPVNTVSLRLGMSSEMSARLFSRAPRTSITSWLSAADRGLAVIGHSPASWRHACGQGSPGTRRIARSRHSDGTLFPTPPESLYGVK